MFLSFFYNMMIKDYAYFNFVYLILDTFEKFRLLIVKQMMIGLRKNRLRCNYKRIIWLIRSLIDILILF